MQMTLLTPTTTAINSNASQYILDEITLPSLTPGETSRTYIGLLMDGSRKGLAIIQTSETSWGIYHIATGCLLLDAKVRNMTALLSAISRTFSYEGNWSAAKVADFNTQAFKSLTDLHWYLS